MAIGVVVRPQRDGIAGLLVGRPEQCRRHEQQEQREHRSPLLAVERRFLAHGHGPSVQRVGRKRGHAAHIGHEPDRHADAGGGEAVVPAKLLAKCPAHQRSQKRAEIDAHVEDRIGAIAAWIARWIESADLGRHVGLERAAADDQCRQSYEEQGLERHQEMPECHQDGADEHGAMLAENAIRQNSAEHRCEIDEPGVQPVDVRGERLNPERTQHRLVDTPERGKPDHVLGTIGLQQVFHHVENEQRTHPVIGEALPHLGREQKRQPARMAEEILGGGRVAGLLGGCHRGLCSARGTTRHGCIEEATLIERAPAIRQTAAMGGSCRGHTRCARLLDLTPTDISGTRRLPRQSEEDCQCLPPEARC